jgi:hypothetical protein
MFFSKKKQIEVMQNVQNSESHQNSADPLPVYGYDDPPSYVNLFNKEASPQNQRVEHTGRPEYTVVQVVVSEPSSPRTSPENNVESQCDDPPESNKKEVLLVCFGFW